MQEVILYEDLKDQEEKQEEALRVFRNSMNKNFKFETSGLVWSESKGCP